MVYYVFLDTNIFEESNFSFRNGKFAKLKELAKTKRVKLLYNEVIYGEVKQHIETNIKNAVAEYNSAIKNRGFAPFRNEEEWSVHLSILDENELIEKQWQEWNAFLEECNAIKIPTQSIDVDIILNKYFKKILPFENKKKDEFKDAIIIESVRKYYFEEILGLIFVDGMYVVSADKGVRNSFRNDKEIKTFDKLNKFINYVILHTEHIALAVNKKFDKKLFGIFIQQNIVSKVYAAKFDVEDYWDDFKIKDVQYTDYTMGYIDVVDNNSVALTVEVSSKICIDYMERDEKRSCYNEEEQSYLFDAFTEYEEWHKVCFEAILLVKVEDIDEKIISDKLNACNDLLQEFDETLLDITISAEDIIIPKGTVIPLNGKTFIERKVLRNIFEGWEYGEEENW